jgi:hypothetical protein
VSDYLLGGLHDGVRVIGTEGRLNVNGAMSSCDTILDFHFHFL